MPIDTISSGASLYDVQKLLGHSDIAMTQRYAHMVDDSLQRATDNVAGVIEGATSNGESSEVSTAGFPLAKPEAVC